MPRTLTYHDVVDGDCDTSGFPGGGPAHYKLSKAEFSRHLGAIRSSSASPMILPDLRTSDSSKANALLLTFDDGGVSAASLIADALEAQGWHGHFFVTTDYIGERGFMNAAQIRDLAGRGHVIGTHSCSHPCRMSACPPQQLLDEWQRSRVVLSDILAAPVTIGSVPGGYYSNNVAVAAAAAGLTDLFTSEPSNRVAVVNGLRVYGRFSVHRGTPVSRVAAIASGHRLTMVRESVVWTLKKILKLAGGRTYLQVRRLILDNQYRSL